MKLRILNKRNQALTLFEVLIVVATLMILAAMLLPIISGPEIRAPRLHCVSNIKQVNAGPENLGRRLTKTSIQCPFQSQMAVQWNW